GGGRSHVAVKDASGQVVYRGLLMAGEARKIVGNAPLQVRAADGGVVSWSVRGKPHGFLGDAGEPAQQLIRAAQQPIRAPKP
ncbi:MAG: DUF4115 domain-containing protein, partial [Nocardioidaceae bacterium]